MVTYYTPLNHCLIFAISKIFLLTARLLATFSSDSKVISKIFFMTAGIIAKFSSDSKAMI